MLASVSPPLSDGGAAISSYKIDWDTNPGVQEVQLIQTSTYTGPNTIQSITTLAQDPALARVNTIQVVQSRIDVSTVTAKGREVQTVHIQAAVGGSFTLSLDTSATGGSYQISGLIASNAEASDSAYFGSTWNGLDVASILSVMPNIAPNILSTASGSPERIDVSRSTYPAGCSGSTCDLVYAITFPASMGDVPTVVVNIGALLPAGTANAKVNSNEAGILAIQGYTPLNGNQIQGSFRLTFQGQTTADIASDASESEMRTKLESLSTVDTVVVSRSTADDQHGYHWTITFNSDLNAGDLSNLVSDSSQLSTTGIGVPSVVVT